MPVRPLHQTSNSSANSKPSTHPQYRWCWIGLCLAFILWLCGNIIEQRVEQFRKIEQFNQDLDTEQSGTPEQRMPLLKIVALTLALGSGLGASCQAFKYNLKKHKPDH